LLPECLDWRSLGIISHGLVALEAA